MPLLLAMLFCLPRAANATTSFITSNFNGTAIPAGDYIWFNSVVSASGVATGADIFITNASIQFTANGTDYDLILPDATLTFVAGLGTATTSFSGTSWDTTVQATGLSGNVFGSGFELLAPAGGLPGGINPVTWTADFSTNTPGVSLQWQWAAAVYTSFNASYNSLGVKPVDDNNASAYLNSDHAGTPESYKSFVIGGARGGGGSNYTGSYSGTASVVPKVCTENCGASVQSVPEPTSFFLALAGLALLVVSRARCRRPLTSEQ